MLSFFKQITLGMILIVGFSSCSKVEIDTQGNQNKQNSANGNNGDVVYPFIPYSLTVIGATPTSVTLAWEEQLQKAVVSYYEISVNPGEPVRVNAPATTVVISELSALTEYNFGIRACDVSDNCSDFSQEQVVGETPSVPDTQAPTVPSGLSASGATMTSINLMWSASTDNVGTTLYRIQTNNANPVTVNAPTLSRSMTGLTAGTAYNFKIQACDASDNCSAYSSNISASTMAAPDTQAPTVPAGLTANSVTMNSLNLVWSASTDNVGVSKYEIQTNSTGTPVSVNHPTLSRSMSGLAASTPYQFRIRSCDASNNCSAYSSNISVTTTAAPDTTAPTVPTGLVASGNTSTSINLNWNASTDAVGVTKYEIQTNSTGAPVAVNVPTLNRTMSGLIASTSYQFRIRACDVANNCSAYSSNITSSTTAAPDTTAPTVPAGLAASGNTSTSINLNWNASTDAIGVTKYEIQTNSTGTPVAVNAPTLNRTMSGLIASTSYQFRVRACDGANNCSAYSSNITSSTTAAPDTTAPSVPSGLMVSNITQTTATFTWTASTDAVGVTGYEVSIDNGTGISVASTTYGATGFVAGTSHNYRVRAKDAAGNFSAYSGASTFTTTAAVDTSAPTVPTNPATSGITSSSINFTWNASTDNVGVTGYEVSINNAAGIAVTGTSYTANSLTASTAYQFKVRAKDAANNFSAYTSNISATTSAASAAPTIPNRTSSFTSIPLYATVVENPPSITVKWANIANVTRSSISIWRRIKGSSSSWGSTIATPSASSNSYVDSAVSNGVSYEYKVQMGTSAGTTTAYMTSGIKVPANTYNGKVVIVADSTLFNATSAQIVTLENAMLSDGWIPVTIFVARTATAPTVKAAIAAVYNADTANVKSVLLVGHVPVPVSGTSIVPDGHGSHNGAWTSDGYYGDINQTWTQGGGAVSDLNMGTGAERNGFPDATSKFSHDTFPSTIELAVGRVDMYNLPAFSQTETQLIDTYFTKVINFKKGITVPLKRGIVVDQLGGAGMHLSVPVLSNMSPAVGPTNITLVEDIYNNVDAGTPPFYQRVNNNMYLIGYGTGYGSNNSCQTVLSTADIVSTNMSSMFNTFFGSWFGDFDSKNNLLRASIAKGLGMTAFYSGDLFWYSQHMAMGETVGYSLLETQNNTASDYSPAHGTCCGGSTHNTYGNLIGDPTLKYFYIPSPTNLTSSGNNLSWTAAPGSVDGYNVYQITSSGITKLNSSLITSTSYTVSSGVSGKRLMVRAQKLETTPAGTYENLSYGALNQF
jgi:chitodextrinase